MNPLTQEDREKLLVVGCGYTGSRVVKRLWSVDPRKDITALVRRGSSLQKLNNNHIPALAWDLDRPAPQEVKRAINELTYHGVVLFSTPPPREGDHDTRMKRFLNDLAGPIKHFIYLSTTGVYGDCQGEWVTEQRAVNPQNERSLRRVSAEEQVRAWCNQRNVPYSILRIAGIYGPGRLPTPRNDGRDTVLKQREAPFGNHIHVDDLVRGCIRLIQDSGGYRVVNVSDGEPRPSGDLRRVVAKAMDLPSPSEIGFDQAYDTFSEMRLSFALESRKIDNTAFLQLLGGPLLYPSLELGVAASLSND